MRDVVLVDGFVSGDVLNRAGILLGEDVPEGLHQYAINTEGYQLYVLSILPLTDEEVEATTFAEFIRLQDTHSMALDIIVEHPYEDGISVHLIGWIHGYEPDSSEYYQD